MAKLVSIIIASYNKEKFIAETIDSVLNQSYKNWELIIVDDCSSDSTTQIISSYVNNDHRIFLYHNTENKGANFSRNYALNTAKGEFVIFLDADDVFTERCIEQRLKVIDNTHFDFCVFTMGTFNKTVGDLNSTWYPNSANPLRDFLRHKLPWSIMQPIWNRRVLMELGGFDVNFNRLQDVELHTRVLLQNKYSFCLQSTSPDCFYRIDDNRKNFSEFEFYKRRTISTVMYCNKFETLVPKNYQKLLLATILKLYLELILVQKSKKMNPIDFIKLKNILFEAHLFQKTKTYQKAVFKLSYIYNRYFFRVPGINKMLELMLIAV